MVSLRYRDRVVSAEPGETVLEALERAGVAPRSSCRGGACQTCLLRAREGTPPAKAQAGLPETARQGGLFLPCLAVPREDLDLVDPEEAQATIEAKLVERASRGRDVSVLRLEPTEPFAYRAGQFVHVSRERTTPSRPYSLASVPEQDALLELHVRAIPGGLLSPWLAEEAPLGTTLTLRGPFGACTYEAEADGRLLLLVGTSTGLAPLLGIARDALRRGHRGGVRLYHGALTPRDLYAAVELRALARAHSSLEVIPCVLAAEGAESAEGAEGLRIADLRELVPDELGDRVDPRVHLCGSPELVQTLRKRLFLQGIPLGEIRADPFLPARS